MKKRVKGKKLSRKKGARVALVKSLAKALIISDRIKTTKAKAKFAQKYVERLVTLTKKDVLFSKRQIFARLQDRQAAKKFVREVIPKFKNVNSGFTRVVNLGQRKGDAAEMVLLEFAYPEETQLQPVATVGEAKVVKQTEGKKTVKAKKEVKNAKKTKK